MITAKTVRYVQYKRFKRPSSKSKYSNQAFKPMEFVSMVLIGKFHPPSSKGNRYALTAQYVCLQVTLFAYPSRINQQRKL